MPSKPQDNHSTYAERMEHFAQRAREVRRPTLVGNSPSGKLQRAAYIFTQTIRSDAERSGIPSHALRNFLLTIQGFLAIPKPKDMAEILDKARAFIRRSEATTEAVGIVLLVDDDGEIILAKSATFPWGFNFRFMPVQRGA